MGPGLQEAQQKAQLQRAMSCKRGFGFAAMFTLLLFCGCFLLQSCGNTEILCQEQTPKCEETVEVFCNGDKTNIIDMCIETYGCHKYERTSYPLASLGPVELNLTKATPDRFNYLWSTFQIKAVVRFTPPVSDLVNISCTDGLTSKALLLARNKTICTTLKKINRSEREIEILWQHPNCEGWSHILNYIVNHCHDSGCVQYKFQNDTTSVKVAFHNTTRQSIEVIAINGCQDSTMIAEYNIEASENTLVNNTVHETGGENNETKLGMILVVVVIIVTIITATVVGLLAAFCAVLFQTDRGEYMPVKMERKLAMSSVEKPYCKNC